VALRQQRDDAHDRDMVLAWTIAALGRQTKLPKVETLFVTHISRPPTVAGQRAQLALLSERYGIPLRKGIKGVVARG
jgi:hypothetical protein